MENPKAYNMEDGRRRRTQEEEGSVPTNPSSPPSSPLSEIVPPNDQRPQTLRVSGLNKLSAISLASVLSSLLDERPFLSFSGRASPLNVLDERTLAGDERFCMCLLWFAL
ncbi:hypothetical protein LR48_Vigan510s000100 [Vigna angularis]|uniref:Uncharacterized protein n=1 Tax=Phaseolus angularis TaxID=3914 RepID=A0A0L9TCR9_PHAAN|nr:hypothetical protein LR48_Vigan510s000100 [Vigna angularis]